MAMPSPGLLVTPTANPTPAPAGAAAIIAAAASTSAKITLLIMSPPPVTTHRGNAPRFVLLFRRHRRRRLRHFLELRLDAAFDHPVEAVEIEIDDRRDVQRQQLRQA